jgi:hypothetical protein
MLTLWTSALPDSCCAHETFRRSTANELRAISAVFAFFERRTSKMVEISIEFQEKAFANRCTQAQPRLHPTPLQRRHHHPSPILSTGRAILTIAYVGVFLTCLASSGLQG